MSRKREERKRNLMSSGTLAQFVLTTTTQYPKRRTQPMGKGFERQKGGKTVAEMG